MNQILGVVLETVTLTCAMILAGVFGSDMARWLGLDFSEAGSLVSLASLFLLAILDSFYRNYRNRPITLSETDLEEYVEEGRSE